MTSTKTRPTTIKTESGTLEVHVVGKRPENEPYIWFGMEGRMIDVIGEKEMRRLLVQLHRALDNHE